MTLPAAVMPSCAVVGSLALAAAVMAIRWGGWAGWTLGILAVIVALAGLGMAGFLAWGHYAGFSWHFAQAQALDCHSGSTTDGARRMGSKE